MVDELPAEMVCRASVDFRAQPTAPECWQKRVYADHADPVMATNQEPARETLQAMASPSQVYAYGRPVPGCWRLSAFSASERKRGAESCVSSSA